ncbi:MAG: type II secretion system protein [Candidatus Moranbacteria bacterium]|nr:type II secretion system protein [Candidatus Moranbacteria bacterium]
MKKRKQKKDYFEKLKCRKSAFFVFRDAAFPPKKGFTLIELVIVVAIVTIMTGVSLTNVSRNKEAKEVEIAASQVASALRSLQNDAVNGKVLTGSSVCRSTLNLVNGEKKYGTSYFSCSSGAQVGAENIFYLSSKKENGIVTSSAASFSFTAPRGDVSSSGFVRLTAGANTYYVCVESSGNIYTQKASCP